MGDTSQTLRRKPRVLIAEDHDGFRELLAESFRAQGYDVVLCRHGIELVGQLRSHENSEQPCEFDLIVSDIRMPGVTGLSVLEGLREFKGMPPFILITAFGDEKTHLEAKRLGAAAMFDKPFEIATLLSEADDILRSSPSRDVWTSSD